MAASSRAQVLRLYRALLRESQRFSAYNYRCGDGGRAAGAGLLALPGAGTRESCGLGRSPALPCSDSGTPLGLGSLWALCQAPGCRKSSRVWAVGKKGQNRDCPSLKSEVLVLGLGSSVQGEQGAAGEILEWLECHKDEEGSGASLF
ncbi:hypothetical protein HGM15179_005892 [Zosterops borbonicus]|uniref:Complex 1 LYR protein domain-containing protein n=1 Tax=Zosterops borbonicus TaxID=364589 RepID=A0A8K1GNG0_9PASS|nr:hypothetical protein HGM15179_005892 [Zosterops borbonicus]